MKTFLAASTLAVLGAAATAEAIVLPKGSHEYHQYGVNFVAPRSVEPSSGGSVKIPMYQHNKRDLSDVGQTLAFAQGQRDYVLRKWGKTEKADQARKRFAKRQILGLSDYGQDNFYFGQVSVGTPKQNFNVILDTGSSDFWVADTACSSSQCDNSALFNPGASSTYVSSTAPFEIRYGTGAVQGRLAADTVSLAGYTVNNQTFAIAEQLAARSLNAPTSGIMGMGFQSLASSEATPFWQVLVEQNRLSQNLFTFQMARNVRTASPGSINPGGIFTLGQLDSNQYNGNINYVPLTGQEGYWKIPLDSISVNGDSGTISGDSGSAIDTGTTLLIAPPSVANSLYARIPGARSLGDLFGNGDDGYYSIPCNSNVDLRLTFGGQSYAINSADLKSGSVDNQGINCLGGILGESLGAGAPNFIVGNVFLKNVFSVYRFSPAAVGFASLKGEAAQTAATTTGAVQAGSPTGSVDPSSIAGGNSPPLFSTVSADSSDSSLAAGAGLPQPTAQSAGDASDPSITPANGMDSTSGNSGNSGGGLYSAAPSQLSHIAMGSTVCLFALAAGLFAVL